MEKLPKREEVKGQAELESDKVVDIAKNQPHITMAIIGLCCCHRWIAVFPAKTLLEDLECPGCGDHGYAIGTGQILEE